MVNDMSLDRNAEIERELRLWLGRVEPTEADIQHLADFALDLPQPRRRSLLLSRSLVSVAAALLIFAVVIAWQAPWADRYETSVAAGLSPGMSVASVARRVRDDLETMRQRWAPDYQVPVDIQSIDAMTYHDAAMAVGLVGNDTSRTTTVWLVRAKGPFVADRGPMASRGRGTEGYFIIDDVDGSVLAYGFGP